jgi:hypothetical protein
MESILCSAGAPMLQTAPCFQPHFALQNYDSSRDGVPIAI